LLKEVRMHAVWSLFVLATLRSTWIYFSTLERLFLVGLSAVSIYVLLSTGTTLLGIRKVSASIRDGSGIEAEKMFILLRKRSSRMDKLVVAAFYVFGMVLFLGLQDSYITIDNSSTPLGWIILRSFEPHFVFASDVFFAFLALHVLGWFVSNSLDRFAVQTLTAPRSS